MIKFNQNQNAWLKPYTDMKNNLRKISKKIFRKLINNGFDTSIYELDRPSPKWKNKSVIGLMKDELGGKIMIKFVALRRRPYSYLIDDGNEDKKA